MNKISIKDKLNNFISDPGIQLTHPKKENVLLEDIFIFPELRLPTGQAVNSRELLNIHGRENRLIISGPEDSGKTTLVKVLIKRYLEAGYYPIYIDAENLAVSDSNELLIIIEKEYEETYSKDICQDIRDETVHKKAIFIDNLHKLNNTRTVVIELLKNLYRMFNNVILTEKIPLNIVNNSQLRDEFPELAAEIKHYEIIEFSDELRLDLIRRWNNIGQKEGSNTNNVLAEVEKTKEFIDMVVRHNLVPSYPIFLLTILQMNNREEEEAASGSSYGHYYEYIITKPLHNSIGKKDVNGYLDFLSKLSYYMFDKQKEEISDEELGSIFNTSLFKNSDVQCCSDVLETMLRADTLDVQESFCRFKYKYAYHYFVAKYLSENINSEPIKDVVKTLCSELNNDASAMIVLFITHLSQDTFIINELLERTKFVLSDTDEFSIEDSPEIEGIIEELSKLGAKDKKLKEFVVQYSSNKADNTKPRSTQNIYEADNLIRIVREILKKQNTNKLI